MLAMMARSRMKQGGTNMSLKLVNLAGSVCFMVASAIAPVQAQDGPIGIAFAQAPEQSTGVCTGQNTDKTLACAREKCAEGGAMAQDCLRVKWCYPAGWSADLFVQHKAGVHWHEYLCGWDSKESVMAAVAVACDLKLREMITDCKAVRFWDAQGKELAAN
ncbi:hypothetical protein [Hoeflea sp.]|uniref:hypothetical protein n=1 Tax=Hoeflea sp. TaxID=1940281 RepID=UPI003BB12815